MSDTESKGRRASYTPRRSFSLTLVPALTAALFAAAGIGLWVFTAEASTLLIAAGGAVFYALTLLTSAALGYGYEVAGKSLILKNGFKKEAIPLANIRKVTLLNEAQAADYLSQLEMTWVRGNRSRDFSAWGKSLKRNTEILRFMSVPLVTSSVSMGRENNITRFKVLSKGEYLLLTLAAGSHRLITPKDSEGLYRFLLSEGALAGIPDAAIAGEREFADRLEEERKDRFPRTFYLVYRVLSIAAAAFIVIAALYGLIVNPEPPAAEPERISAEGVPEAAVEEALGAERPEEGWIDGDTLLVRVDSQYWPREDQSRETRIALMREFGDLEAEGAFARFVAEGYAAERGLEPGDMDWDRGLQALKDWAGTLPKRRVWEDLGERLRFGKFVYEFSALNLRGEAENRFGSFR